MSLEDILLARIQSSVNTAQWPVMKSRCAVIAGGIARGVLWANEELDSHYGFGVTPEEMGRLRARYPLNGSLAPDVLSRIELPLHLGRPGETALDALLGASAA